ncbi:unnamed protein product, partial [Effrenium voratum]
ERITEYALEVPCEGEHQDLDTWRSPVAAEVFASSSQPLLMFQKVSLRYQPDLPLALNSVSFTLNRKERLAVVGRTGSGKSTLAVALFRLCPIEGGQVRLLGQDLAQLPLDVARRSMGIITQDPVIFSGTVQYNLDPFGEFDDQTCMEALQHAQLALTLKSPIEQAGSNLSVGERQLLCLARALLRKPRLLVCDEATSSVDAKTDQSVQLCLRRAVQTFEASLLTIAHRLITVADYDKVMVLQSGQLAELGAPGELLRTPDSAFSQLVQSMGSFEAAAIRQAVERIEMGSRLDKRLVQVGYYGGAW